MASSSNFGRSENLALNSRTFAEFSGKEHTERMTVRGAIARTAILLAILTASAAGSWLSIPHDAGVSGLPAWLGSAILAALIVGVITAAKKRAAPITAPLYAFLEGSVLGGISAVFEAYYPGIVAQAVLLTFGVLFGLLLVYRLSGFRVTRRFAAGVLSATLAVVLVYLLDLILGLLGYRGLHLLYEGGLIGIGINLFVVFVAALNLVLDFDLIESGAREGAPRYMEWYAAYGLMVTLIWLYLEILKLLAQLAASRDND